MGDESVASSMSGMSTGDAGGPPLGGAGAGGAEGVMKKLSNYWFIVGSIPMVLFLIVCLPTVFYVHSISSYVNAFYCRSKACDNLADTTKAARNGNPCDTYIKSVCAASTKHKLKFVYAKDQDILGKALKLQGDDPNPKFAVVAASKTCGGGAEDIPGTTGPAVTYLFGASPPAGGLQSYLLNGDNYANIFVKAQKIGIDSIFHLELVHSDVKMNFNDNERPTIGEKLPPQHNYYDLAVSAPDMGIMDPQHYIVGVSGKKYEDMVAGTVKAYINGVPEDTTIDDEGASAVAKLTSKYYQLIDVAKDKDYTAAPTVVEVSKFGEDSNSSINFRSLLTKMYPGLQRVIVRSPTHVRYLSLNVKPGPPTSDDPFKEDAFKLFVGVDALGKLIGYANAAVDLDTKHTWCLRYYDWMKPLLYTASVDDYLGKGKYWPIGLYNAKDIKKPFKSMVLGDSYFKELMDSFLHSYSLSEASSEKSRAGLYLKMLQMDKVVFYPNSSNDIDTTYVDFLNSVPFADGDTPDALMRNRAKFFESYWTLTPKPIERKYLLARHPMMFGDDEGSYDYGSNAIYVSFGMFRPSFYRDSPVYEGNYAVFGYWGSMNILKMLDNVGSHSKVGYQHPVLWAGTYAYGKMNSHYRCFNPEGKNETKARMIAKGSNPLTPGFRFFRRKALAKAMPRPEYRLDADADATMEQIYFTAVARTYCRYEKMATEIDKMFQHDLYFQSAYCGSGGKLKIADPNKACYMWRSTRRSY